MQLVSELFGVEAPKASCYLLCDVPLCAHYTHKYTQVIKYLYSSDIIILLV